MRLRDAPRPLIIAHRAGNSLAELAEAIDLRPTLIEVDVWPYRGRLEARHSKTMGPVPLLWDRWLLAAGWAPRLQLREVLRLCPPEAGLLLDLKGHNVQAMAAVRRLVDALHPEGVVAVCSQNWAMVEAFRAYPRFTRLHSIGTRRALRRFLAQPTWHEDCAVSIHRRLLSPPVITALKHHAPTIVTWPVNTLDGAGALLAAGVDGVITDSFNVLRALHAAEEGGQ